MRSAGLTSSTGNRPSPPLTVVSKPTTKRQGSLSDLTSPLTDHQLITATALDVLEERLAKGEKLLKEARSRPNTLDRKSLAQEIGLPGTWLFVPFKKRLDALVEKYGLTSRGLERYSFEEFRMAALKRRAEQISKISVAEREKVLRGLDAAFDWAASLSPGASARKTLAIAALAVSGGSAVASKDSAGHLSWARNLFQNWLKNSDLPKDPAALLSVGLARLGMRVHQAARKSSLTTACLKEILNGQRRPRTTQYRKINSLEQLLGLPEGAAVKGYLRLPPEAADKTDGDVANIDYRLHDLPEAGEREFADFIHFRTSKVVPRGMKRYKVKPRPATFKMMRDMFATFYGFCTTPLNSEFQIDPMDVGMALLLFPDLVHASWEFVVERTKKSPTTWGVDWLRKWMRLLDPVTGFITQSPGLADRLVPVRDVRGKFLVSPEDIARVKADWRGACAIAREEFAALRKSQSEGAEPGEDQLAGIEEILKRPNPFDAFRMLCQGLRHQFLRAKRDFDGAAVVRNVIIAGLLTQCAFRGFTVEQLNLDHLVRDPKTGRWWMRVPRELFKNPEGPYFRIGRSKHFHPLYECELLNKHGLYSAISAYLGWARALILKNDKGYKTDALIVTEPRARRGLRGRSNHQEPGRVTHDYLAKLSHQITAEHVGYNEKTGKGIKGVKSFSTHRFRAILATGIMKRSKGTNPKAEAAAAIHDSENTVEIYTRFLPQDRAKSIKQTKNRSY
jgi:hypothetical protein